MTKSPLLPFDKGGLRGFRSEGNAIHPHRKYRHLAGADILRNTMAPIDSLDPVNRVITYHERTKHHFHRYVRGPGYLEWATQPDPFRRYLGAILPPLEHITPGDRPLYDDALMDKRIQPVPVDRRTEGYLLCGDISDLCNSPLLAHYAPKKHALEVRARIPTTLWKRVFPGLPRESVLVGLSPIHWREAWKYGAWFYPRLYWECGIIGQVLYLEAEACRIRATGMGCYFDDPMHEVLGLRGGDYQSLYHFTVGGAIEDPRLQSLPAYPIVKRHNG
jgi:hypothetical protein